VPEIVSCVVYSIRVKGQRGQKSPILLLNRMIKKEQIAEIAEKHLQGTDKYLIDISVKPGNKITLVIDSDTSVMIDDCSRLSKAVEASLNRDLEDFELNVTSYGADKPLINKRQFTKNIGRQLVITTKDEKKIKGKLVTAGENFVTLEAIANTKQKEKTTQAIEIEYNNIEQAKIILAFK